MHHISNNKNLKTDSIQEEKQSQNLNSSLETLMVVNAMLTKLKYECNKELSIRSVSFQHTRGCTVFDEANHVDEE